MLQLIAILLGLSTALDAGGPPADPPPTPRPSVVLVIADDAGWIDFGFNGGTEIATPEMDRLAGEGLTFGACYVTASVCSPSRAGMLTGRHQQRFGHEYNLPGSAPRPEGGLPLDEATIANRFEAAGLATGLVGKWHLGLADRFHPTRRGFDEFHGLRAGSRSYFGDGPTGIELDAVPTSIPAGLPLLGAPADLDATAMRRLGPDPRGDVVEAATEGFFLARLRLRRRGGEPVV